MKTNQPLNDDESLRSLLREWKEDAALPPRFQEQVWRRIEREDARSAAAAPEWTAWRRWLAQVLPRPALAVAYIAVLLVAGAGIGWTRAQHESLRVRNQLIQRYVKSVDPYQALP